MDTKAKPACEGAPEELARHSFADALGPPGDDHIEGGAGGSPEALHAKAVEHHVEGPHQSPRRCGAPVTAHVHPYDTHGANLHPLSHLTVNCLIGIIFMELTCCLPKHIAPTEPRHSYPPLEVSLGYLQQ